MTRKKNRFQRITIIFLALALCLLSGCSGDDALLPEAPQDEHKGTTTLEFTVCIADDAPTRALTAKTKFEVGEYIGLYIYKKGTNTILNDYKNLKAQVYNMVIGDEYTPITYLSISPRITDDADIVAYYPYDETGYYSTVPETGSFPYIATATATPTNAKVNLNFTLNVAKLEITLIACPQLTGYVEMYPGINYVFGQHVRDSEITEYSRNKGGWRVYTINKYLYPGNYKGNIFHNGSYKAPEKNKTFEAGKIYKYNYNFATKEENSNLITSIEDFRKIENKKKYSQIKDLTSPDGKFWKADVELIEGAYNGNGFLVQDYSKYLFSRTDRSEIQNVYMDHTVGGGHTEYLYGLVENMEGGTISGCKRIFSGIGANDHITRYTKDGSNAGLALRLQSVGVTATVVDIKYSEPVDFLFGEEILKKTFCMIYKIYNSCKFNEVYTSTIYAQNAIETSSTDTGADPGNNTICSWRKFRQGNQSTDYNKDLRYKDIINGVYDGVNPYNSSNKMYPKPGGGELQGCGIEVQHIRFARWYAQWEFVKTDFGPNPNVGPWPNHYKIRTFTNSYWARGLENRQFVHNKANGKQTIVCDWETFENNFFEVGKGYEDKDSRFTQKPKLWWEVAPEYEWYVNGPPQLEHY